MNKSMILELVTGGDYFDNINMVDNDEYNERLNELRKMLENFCGGMTEKEKDEIMWQFAAARGGLEEIIADEYFKRGFKLGLIIAAQNFLE